MDANICKLKDLAYNRHSIEFHFCSRLDRHSFRAAEVASTNPIRAWEMTSELMFLTGIKSQRLGTSSFSGYVPLGPGESSGNVYGASP